MTRDELEDLIKRAKAAFAALTPEQQAAHRREQAISWMYGEACFGLNDTFPEKHLSREECAEIYDEMGGRYAKKKTDA